MELEAMLELGAKAEIEALYSQGGLLGLSSLLQDLIVQEDYMD